MKKILKIGIITIIIIGIIYVGMKKNLNLSNMVLYETEHYYIYYDKSLSDTTLQNIKMNIEEEYNRLKSFFPIAEKKKGTIVVYEDIAHFQRAYLGLILSLFYGDWACGAAFEDIVMVTSPDNPGTKNKYDDIMQVITHEYVHALIYRYNENINVWLDEGSATYLAGQGTSLPPTIPSFESMQSDSMGDFLDNHGYTFGSSYIEYIDKTYGKNSVLELIKTEDYEHIFGKTNYEIYCEWKKYIEKK